MILITYGTRPEWLKVKPIIKEMDKRNYPYKVLFTGQHKDIAPNDADYNFQMNYVINNNRLDTIVGNILRQTDILDDDEITHILVQGDTTSVLGIALSAFNHKKKIIHLEAGLRSNDLENPYPEEGNRQLVSRITDIHLCPTKESEQNLNKENIFNNIYVVGNTSLDNLIDFKEKCKYTDEVLITLHRRENQQCLDDWFHVINNIAKRYTEIKFTLPIHPNPNIRKYRNILTNINVIEPLEHNELLNLLVKVKLVITDSGGLQEECSFLNKKCLTCRVSTERPEAIGITTFLVTEPTLLVHAFDKHIKSYGVDKISPFGDGYSSARIVDIFEKLI